MYPRKVSYSSSLMNNVTNVVSSFFNCEVGHKHLLAYFQNISHGLDQMILKVFLTCYTTLQENSSQVSVTRNGVLLLRLCCSCFPLQLSSNSDYQVEEQAFRCMYLEAGRALLDRVRSATSALDISESEETQQYLHREDINLSPQDILENYLQMHSFQ